MWIRPTVRGGRFSFNIHAVLFISVIMRPASDDKSTDENTPKGPLRTSYLAPRRRRVTKMQLQRPWEGLQKDFAPWSRTQRPRAPCHLQLVWAQRQRWQGHAKPPATAADGCSSAPGLFNRWQYKISHKNPFWSSQLVALEMKTLETSCFCCYFSSKNNYTDAKHFDIFRYW